jgi:hypothetical protein
MDGYEINSIPCQKAHDGAVETRKAAQDVAPGSVVLVVKDNDRESVWMRVRNPLGAPEFDGWIDYEYCMMTMDNFARNCPGYYLVIGEHRLTWRAL